MLAKLQQKYKLLPTKEKAQIIALTVCVVLSAYGFTAALMWQEMFEAEKMANRKANRIETRIGKIVEPKLSSDVSEIRLKKLSKELAQSTEALDELTKRFIPIDNAARLQELKLDVSQLADDINLKINTFEVIGIEYKTDEEELSEYTDTRRKYYQRPYFAIEGQGKFYALLNFLQALNQLDNIAIIQKITIERSEQGQLKVSMKIIV